MKTIYNKFIPFPGFVAINLFGILFIRKEYIGKITLQTLNHESIHSAQMKELWWIGFYIWYLLEWIIRLWLPGDAYRNISFEREAYQNQKKSEYLKTRRTFASFQYLKKKN